MQFISWIPLLLFLMMVIISIQKFQKRSKNQQYFDEHGSMKDSRIWLKVDMPKYSLFGFDPPNDRARWKKAQIHAMNGDQILLRHSLSVFQDETSFLDGDIHFRKYHKIADMFVDKNRDLTPLVLSVAINISEHNYPPLKVREQAWESIGQNLIPRFPSKYWNIDKKTQQPYIMRAPVVKIGYNAFSINGSKAMFEGPVITPVFVTLGDTERKTFFDYWVQIRDKITTPVIFLHASDENWGLLSTYFPNRTASNWGRCCSRYEYRMMNDILNHNKTLLFLVNQHANFTHPKLLTLPRGLPITGTNKATIYEYLKHLLGEGTENKQEIKKKTLVFASSSSWGYRPTLLKCVSNKFKSGDFSGLSFTDYDDKKRMTRKDYYNKLGTAMFGLAIPGIGYDTYRLWESMTFGSVAILERGVGFDKSVHRLPALLVDDFNDVTPDLLRIAYVEALYRATDFEFERLNMNFWLSFIANVSQTMTTQTLWDKFPQEIDVRSSQFTRPKIPFDCGINGEKCGIGTKKTPKSYC